MARETGHLELVRTVLQGTLRSMLVPSELEAEFEMIEDNEKNKLDIYMADSTVQLYETNIEHSAGHFYLEPMQAAHLYGSGKRIISFIFVKDTAHLGKVSKLFQYYGGRKIGTVNELLKPGTVVEEGSFKADVYFGTAKDLASEGIWELLFTWYSKMNFISLGYLVFHNINMINLPPVSEMFPADKVHRIIIANDHNRDLGVFINNLEFLRIDKSPTYDTSINGDNWVRVQKLKTGLPLRKVYKHWYHIDTQTELPTFAAANYITENLLGFEYGKVVCFYNGNAEGRHIARMAKCDYEYVSSDCEEEERLTITDRFDNSGITRLLLVDYSAIHSIAVSNVASVLLVNIIPSIDEYISAAGLVSSVGGICTVMASPSSIRKCDSVSEECLTKQVAKYYDIKSMFECNCCGKYQSRDIKGKHAVILRCCKEKQW